MFPFSSCIIKSWIYFPVSEDILIRNIHSYIKLTKKIKVLKENYCWIKFLSKVSRDLVLCSNFLTIVSSDLTWLTFTSVMSNIADIINTNKPASTGALTFSPHHIYINLSNSRKLTDIFVRLDKTSVINILTAIIRSFLVSINSGEMNGHCTRTIVVCF